ncbi:hypothetical protein SprV_0200806700 [Sparganum proliferum]
MAAPTQLSLSQQDLDAEDSRPLQYISVRDSVLPPQLQYAAKTAQVEVVEPACLLRVHRPSLCSVKQRQADDDLVHLQIRAELKTMTISNCALKAAEDVVLDGEKDTRVPSFCLGATAPEEDVAGTHLLQLALFREPGLAEGCDVHLVAHQFVSH